MSGPAAGRAPAGQGAAAPSPGGRPAASARRPLLITCALRVEAHAVRRGVRSGHGPADGAVALLRTGMGPQAAGRAVTAALARDPALRHAAVLATGLCAGVAGGLGPGDVVVDDRGTGCGMLAAALRELGATVHVGRIASADRVVRGAERTALRASGALAADMESAAVRQAALAAGPRPHAAVRVVADTCEHELLRVGTLRTGITALSVLRSVVPAFLRWHRFVALPWR